jgi:hypothetical protein
LMHLHKACPLSRERTSNRSVDEENTLSTTHSIADLPYYLSLARTHHHLLFLLYTRL